MQTTHSSTPTTIPYLMIVTEGPIRCMIGHQETVKEAPKL